VDEYEKAEFGECVTQEGCCDECALSLSRAPEPPAGTQGSAAMQGAAGQRLPGLSAQKPGKSGFFGVTGHKCYKAAPWWAEVYVLDVEKAYIGGQFAQRSRPPGYTSTIVSCTL